MTRFTNHMQSSRFTCERPVKMCMHEGDLGKAGRARFRLSVFFQPPTARLSSQLAFSLHVPSRFALTAVNSPRSLIRQQINAFDPKRTRVNRISRIEPAQRRGETSVGSLASSLAEFPSAAEREKSPSKRRSAASPELQFANANANGRTGEVKVQRASDSQCLGERGTF